jgi:hypothetical protein
MVVVVGRTSTTESDGSFPQKNTERKSERIESKLAETSREYIKVMEKRRKTYN